ncbi:hypothetical protein K431DRAFT_288548 [Polychaeton citri CBS 116435]|uniref:G-patch domain-containing protein n=1 Tax=Polychaeton citri CBS 116435 TaxID=1314669 RepID=A0A9P4ULK2_9PEZI|nr:hypothetical protein K431DRAFT_288548 [Polychaeton citri CBS 116435]
MSGSDDEDDYLSMSFLDQPKPTKETSIQRTARLKREAAERGKVPSKQELAERERKTREEALATKLDDANNKGAKMMARMGFKGGALGKSKDARTEPVGIEMKDDRGGIGMDSEKKRKVREAAEAAGVGAKKVKVSEDEYRERNRMEREERRAEGLWWGAMKVLEGFEVERKGERQESAVKSEERSKSAGKPLSAYNILYRTLVRDRVEKERERRRRRDLEQSLSQKHALGDTDTDEDDRLALNTEVEEVEEEDLELDEHEALPATEKLAKIVGYLREKYYYCFWCKFTYPDAEMEDCPGLTEDEHG